MENAFEEKKGMVKLLLTEKQKTAMLNLAKYGESLEAENASVSQEYLSRLPRSKWCGGSRILEIGEELEEKDAALADFKKSGMLFSALSEATQE